MQANLKIIFFKKIRSYFKLLNSPYFPSIVFNYVETLYCAYFAIIAAMKSLNETQLNKPELKLSVSFIFDKLYRLYIQSL